jgi:hypothetical protein
MVPSTSRVQQFILHSLVPIICSIAVGFILFQDGVFHRSNGSFQFLWSAVVASVVYNLLLFLRPRDASAGLLLLLMATLLTTESTRVAFILRDIFYVGAIGAAIMMYFRYFKQGAHLHYAYSAITLAGIYGVVYVIAGEIHLAIIRTFVMEDTGGNIVLVAENTAFFGLLIGFAVGAGISLADKIFGQIKKMGEGATADHRRQ